MFEVKLGVRALSPQRALQHAAGCGVVTLPLSWLGNRFCARFRPIFRHNSLKHYQQKSYRTAIVARRRMDNMWKRAQSTQNGTDKQTRFNVKSVS